MNTTFSAINQAVLTMLLVAQMSFASSGEEKPTKDAPPAVQLRKLGAGDHTCTLMMGEWKRKYRVHVPASYHPEKKSSVVLALHGAAMNGSMMVWFSGLTRKSDEAGFIVVYPSGTGIGPFLVWNAGRFDVRRETSKPDDVAFIDKLLDDLGTRVTIDEKRVYACGMSNGAMMSYRLAAELSDRIAAVAPVAGTISIDESKPKRPVPIIHFHGTKDKFVPFERRKEKSFLRFKSVEESIQTWVQLNGCDKNPKTETISKEDGTMKVTRASYGGGKDGAEVVLVVVEEGGHTWPGQQLPVRLLGKSVKDISANDLMWEFFERHPMK